MARRKHISLKEKLAATLREMMIVVDGKLERAIPHDDAKKMTSDQIISLWQFDHNVHHAIGGSDEHWNLTPRMIAEHRTKTREKDVPQLAKTKRIAAAHAAHVAKTTLTPAADAEPSIPERTKPRRRMRPDGFTYDWKARRYVKTT